MLIAVRCALFTFSVENAVDDKLIEKKIDEIVSQFCTVPNVKSSKRGKLGIPRFNKSRTLNVDAVQDSLEYLRISVKYILFDLEATRRENKYLREILDK